MFREERLRLIMETINEKKVVHVKELSRLYNCSPSMIRIDLKELESRGLLSRTHGGAISAENLNQEYAIHKTLLQLRRETYQEEKSRIGKAVVDLIHDGDSVMIDGGSTTFFVAQNLNQKRGLTIITTSLLLMPLIRAIPDAKVFLTGGMYYDEFDEMIGEITLESIARFKPDHTIMGIDGISVEYGLTSTEPTVAPLKRKMVSNSRDLIVVSDSTKFGKVCLLPVADLSKAQKIVTDNKLSPQMAEAIKNKGPSLLLV